jgi:hypothetical protein
MPDTPDPVGALRELAADLRAWRSNHIEEPTIVEWALRIYGAVAALEKREAFVRAALEFNEVWTSDFRNTRKWDEVAADLDQKRFGMYEAYRALVAEKDPEERP